MTLDSCSVNEILTDWEIFGWNKDEGILYIGHDTDRERIVTISDTDAAFMTGLHHTGIIKNARVIRESDNPSGIVNFAIVGVVEKRERNAVNHGGEVLLFRLTVNNEADVEKVHFTVKMPVHRLV